VKRLIKTSTSQRKITFGKYNSGKYEICIDGEKLGYIQMAGSTHSTYYAIYVWSGGQYKYVDSADTLNDAKREAREYFSN
jgi:hypothetical protein